MLGTGSTADKTVPTAVAATAGVTSGWAAVSANGYHACGISAGSNALFCWGEC